jgi:hypothetical protein
VLSAAFVNATPTPKPRGCGRSAPSDRGVQIPARHVDLEDALLEVALLVQGAEDSLVVLWFSCAAAGRVIASSLISARERMTNLDETIEESPALVVA